MPSPEPFLVFTQKLNALGFRYMVSGSVAAMYYGEPRLTNDVDIILLLESTAAGRLTEAFPNEEFYCPPEDVVALEAARDQRGHFNIIDHRSGFKADIYLAGRDALHTWALEKVVEVEIDGVRVRIAPPEYVILRKLEYYREGRSPKHPRDIQRMLVSLGDEWPRGELLRMVEERGLVAGWREVCGEDVG